MPEAQYFIKKRSFFGSVWKFSTWHQQHLGSGEWLMTDGFTVEGTCKREKTHCEKGSQTAAHEKYLIPSEDHASCDLTNSPWDMLSITILETKLPHMNSSPTQTTAEEGKLAEAPRMGWRYLKNHWTDSTVLEVKFRAHSLTLEAYRAQIPAHFKSNLWAHS